MPGHQIEEGGLTNQEFLQPEMPVVAGPETPVETRPEESGEAVKTSQEGKITKESSEAAAPVSSATPAAKAPVVLDKLEKEVEEVLAEDLDEVYTQLPPDKKIEFKKEGEETAIEVTSLLRQVKIKTTKIYHLIKNWLKRIPGVNHFFLTQEAKIKTDKVVELEMEERGENQK
jgi:hypothetical protein